MSGESESSLGPPYAVRPKARPFAAPRRATHLRKGAALYRRQIGGLWTRARQALEQAEELVVFGYSFPDADYGARTLLRGAFHQNPDLQAVTVIDVSAAVASRIADLLGVEALHFYRDAAAFSGDQ